MLYLAFCVVRTGCQRPDCQLAFLRPAQRNGIKRIAFGREAEVFACEGFSFGVVETPSGNFGRTLSIDLLGSRAVHGLSVYREPLANFA